MPDFRISSFTSKLQGGGARSNLMEMTLGTVPGGGTATDWKYLCKGSQIPPSNITPIEVPYFGRQVKVAGESREFPALSTIVVNDEMHTLKAALEKWMMILNGHKSNMAKTDIFATRSGYTTQMSLKMFKKDGTKDQEWKFIGAWPSNISAIDLSWDSGNTIQEFTVDWQYDYYTHEQANVTS